MTEIRRGAIRIGANYVGLGVTMLFALALVPILLSIGNDMFGAVALLGATVGLAAMLKDIVRASLVRELGVAYHSDRVSFLAAYNSACALSVSAAAITSLVFVLLAWWLVPVLNFPPDMVRAAQWFVVFKAVDTGLVVALAPIFNMYLVQERMVAVNGWRVANQASYVIAAIVVLGMGLDDEARALVLYGGLSTVLVSGVVLVASVWLLMNNRDLRPRPRLVTVPAIRAILSIGGWNTAVNVASALHIRLGAVIMNLYFGVTGNQLFGAATILSSHTRRVAAGLTNGLDAVSTRLSTADASQGTVERLVHHSARLHGLAVFPTAMFVFLMAAPFTDLWISRRLDDPQTHLPLVVLLICVLLVGRAVRGISDGWMRILYGGGHVRRYAPTIIVGGLLSPVLAVVLIKLLPTPWNIVGPAVSYSAVILVVHGVALPLTAAKCLALPPSAIFAPLLRPALITLLSAPILLAARAFITDWSWTLILASALAYAACYWILAYHYFLRDRERAYVKAFFNRSLSTR